LEEIQLKIENEQVTFHLQEEEVALQKKYLAIVRLEEENWRLKSISLWLKSRDCNTSFFHKQAKARTVKNNVKEITREDGTKIDNFEDLKKVARAHFCSLFTQ
jgi:hypothetical protein